MVAAYVDGLDNEKNWILAEVVNYDHSSGKYEVSDADEEEKARYVLARRRVIPLPLMRANPETDANALFPRGATVVALHPQTTCFYKAVVDTRPSNALEDYELVFEDASFDEGYSAPLKVPQRYVLSMKEIKNRTGKRR